MFDKVFISYAKEDQEIAEKLYDFLESCNYDPWLDKKKLLPGHQWNTEIRHALKKADFIILLLSKVSVSKRGYVQREFRLALEYCEEKLDSDIYIIPCKLDNCEVPNKLEAYQWIELINPEAFEQILNSLNHQQKIYKETERKKIASNSLFQYSEININKIIGKKPQNTVDISYPQFTDTTNEDLRLLNNYIEYNAFKSYNGFLNPFGNGLFETNNPDKEYPFPDNVLEMSYKIEFISEQFISYTIYLYTYTGGAHGMYGTTGYNYRLNSLYEISIETLFDYNGSILPFIQSYCKEALKKKAEDEYDLADGDQMFFENEPMPAKWETFENFYFNSEGIAIIFGIYQVAPYVFGENEVHIKFDDLLAAEPTLATLRKMKELLNT